MIILEINTVVILYRLFRDLISFYMLYRSAQLLFNSFKASSGLSYTTGIHNMRALPMYRWMIEDEIASIHTSMYHITISLFMIHHFLYIEGFNWFVMKVTSILLFILNKMNI